MRYALTLEYDGGDYSGWQRQLNAYTVQQATEEALRVLTGEETVLFASGRTDAGVHAAGQVAHFDVQKELDVYRFRYSLNALLPADIKAVGMKRVPDDFHAQYSAKQKTYSYRMYVSRTPSPLRRRRFARITPPFDVKKFIAAAKLFEGEHDFKAFGNTGSGVTSTVRTVYRAEVKVSGDEIILYLTGNGFLYNMVRVIAGTLVRIASGKMSADEIPRMFKEGVRTAGIKTMPPNGLTLESVRYSDYSDLTAEQKGGAIGSEDVESVIRAAIESVGEEKQKGVDWTRVWSKKYPILNEYGNFAGIEKYLPQVAEICNGVKTEYGLTDVDAFLAVKDIIYRLYKEKSRK